MTPRHTSFTSSSLWAAIVVVVAAGACAGGSPSTERVALEPATLVLTGGKIVTVDERTPEVEALAVQGDTIVAVGTSDEIAAMWAMARRWWI